MQCNNQSTKKLELIDVMLACPASDNNVILGSKATPESDRIVYQHQTDSGCISLRAIYQNDDLRVTLACPESDFWMLRRFGGLPEWQTHVILTCPESYM